MTNARILTDRLAELLRREQASMADFLVALADFDRRGAWLELGYSSLFYFLPRELRLSKGSAYYRKTAAELVQRFPEIVEPMRDGRLCITSLVPLAKVLTPENRGEMLPRFFHRSKKEAMEVAATMQPVTAPPHRDVVTALPIPSLPHARVIEAGAPPPPAMELVQPVDQTLSRTAAGETLPLPAPSRRDSAEPLSEALSRLHVTVSRQFLEKIEAARAALSHLQAGASTEQVLEAGLDLVLLRHAKRKGLVEKPRAVLRSARPETLRAVVKREVWTRDGGRCQWPLESGGICGSTFRVEFDHQIPRADDGPSTAENVRLLCRVHNDLAARQRFGEAWMDQFTRRRSG